MNSGLLLTLNLVLEDVLGALVDPPVRCALTSDPSHACTGSGMGLATAPPLICLKKNCIELGRSLHAPLT